MTITDRIRTDILYGVMKPKPAFKMTCRRAEVSDPERMAAYRQEYRRLSTLVMRGLLSLSHRRRVTARRALKAVYWNQEVPIV